jgi:hypothetical protein
MCARAAVSEKLQTHCRCKPMSARDAVAGCAPTGKHVMSQPQLWQPPKSVLKRKLRSPAYVLTMPLQISMRLMPPSSEQYSHSHALSMACKQHTTSAEGLQKTTLTNSSLLPAAEVVHARTL